MAKKIFILNSRGEKEPFSLNKVYNSARRVGASKKLASRVALEIQRQAFPGISTSEIFDRIFEILFKQSSRSAILFNLKRAILKLGPTGFPFEKYIGKIFLEEGFSVKLNQIIPGRCAKYEIDFLAEKEGLLYIGECKFHHRAGERVDLQVALGNYARFLDIEQGGFIRKGIKAESILVTNTKFTSQALRYCKCVGVKLLGWKYPFGSGLEKLIEKNRFYPITILPQISSFTAKALILKGIVLAKDVLRSDFRGIAREQGLSGKKAENILKEAGFLFPEPGI